MKEVGMCIWYLLGSNADASFLSLPLENDDVAEEEERGGGGGGGGIDLSLLCSFTPACLAWAEEEDSSVAARISVLETLDRFLWPHCNNTSPAPRLGLGVRLGLLSCRWVGLRWWLSELGEVGRAPNWDCVGSWVVGWDRNLNGFVGSKVETVLVVRVSVNPSSLDMALMAGFLPLLKGTQSGLTLWYL